MSEDWTSMSISNNGGSAKEEKAMEKSYTDLEEKQEIEQRRDKKIKQKQELNLRPNTGSKQLEFRSIETRVKEINAKTTVNGIAPGWKSLNNYKEAVNGRIWIIWDDSRYDVKLITSSAQMIHCHINERSKGYFNALLSPKDRLAGAPVNLNEIKDFADCVKIGNARISSRIDRAFGNDAWMDKWGHVILEYGNPGVSDHSSMQLLLHQNYQQVRASFKFFNVWTEHESFLELVETVWKQNKGRDAMKMVWYKLKALQPVLKQLNRREFKYIGKQIEEARNDLADIQNQLCNQANDDLVTKEKDLLTKLEKWSLIEESSLRQKARAKWIKLGDANNKYFSSVIKERNYKKHIRSLMSIDGKMLYDPQEIQDEFVLFYKSLMGTAADNLPAINVRVMKRGHVLSRQHRIQLCATITDQEIAEALKSI
nr:uncharacterized protein LOC101259634 [Solanum lycopersicum]